VGLRPDFQGFWLPKGGFGVWGFCPPNPALAGNACRWALALKKFTEIAKATYTP